ncbi:hypothetical protein ACFS2C_18830 [Prauserella oleivorans]|uniref:Beta-lactamase class A n=1 Tax=Prauserella oleivorans TaxID=1478153 RepID=A0ABW5WBT6_9PSEU
MKPRALAVGLSAAVLIAVGVTAAAHHPPGEPAGHATTTARAPYSAGVLARPAEPAAPPPTPASPREQANLAAAVSDAVNEVVPGTDIGLAVYDRTTESMLTSINPDEQFYTASVMKLLIVTEVLRQAGWRLPAGEDRTELQVMLSGSADWVANVLWNRHGGTEIDRNAAHLMGLTGTTPPTDPEQWEMTRMTPRDIVTVYDYIDEKMPATAGDFVLDALARTTRIALDGFDQHFGIPAALPNTAWAIKQGWMEIDNGVVLNTTGVVGTGGRYIVALFTLQPDGTGFDSASEAVTAGMAALAPTLAGRPPR